MNRSRVREKIRQKAGAAQSLVNNCRDSGGVPLDIIMAIGELADAVELLADVVEDLDAESGGES
jgi:hypothetical protein